VRAVGGSTDRFANAGRGAHAVSDRCIQRLSGPSWYFHWPKRKLLRPSSPLRAHQVAPRLPLRGDIPCSGRSPLNRLIEIVVRRRESTTLVGPRTLVSARWLRTPPQSATDRRYIRRHTARCPHLKNDPTRTIRIVRIVRLTMTHRRKITTRCVKMINRRVTRQRNTWCRKNSESNSGYQSRQQRPWAPKDASHFDLNLSYAE
jgi:hypothetical protein